MLLAPTAAFELQALVDALGIDPGKGEFINAIVPLLVKYY